MAKENLGKVMMIPKGEYSNDITYEILDIVTYNGGSYVCKKDSKGNIPTNLEYWQVIVEKPEIPDVGIDYSTEEKVIGTWIDGKPVYRKVFTGTLPAPDINGGNWISLDYNMSNLVHLYGDVSNRPYHFQCVNRNGSYMLALDFVISNNTLMYRNLGYSQGSTYNITVEYTRTTD